MHVGGHPVYKKRYALQYDACDAAEYTLCMPLYKYALAQVKHDSRSDYFGILNIILGSHYIP